MKGMWERSGSVWKFLPVPCVTVEPCMTSRGPGWQAMCSGKPLPSIKAHRRSDIVKRNVWEYFDRRVEL